MTLARKPWKPGAYSTIKPSRRPTKREADPEADPVTPEVYDAVMRRDGGCLLRGSGTQCGGRVHWHHRLKREYGGRSTAANGACLCTRHHSRVHNHTPETQGRGLLLSRGEKPEHVPVLLVSGRRVYLTDDGEYREAA